MTDTQKEVYETTKSIMQICKDGEKGYKNAAENIDNRNLETLFIKLSQQRKVFYMDLEEEVRVLYGKDVYTDGTFKGAAHRMWQDTKATFSGDTTDSTLEECIRGEKAALEAYQEAMTVSLPASIMDRMEEQYGMISSSLMQMETLEVAAD